MGPTSKDLLSLERENSSSLESTLLLCKREPPSKIVKPLPTNEKLETMSLPTSKVLGKVKAFLGVMEEANKRLQHDAQMSQNDLDIELLTGNETEVIEMDLLLGVADLHTPEAVAAAESALVGLQPAVLAAGSSGSYSSSSDNDSDSDSDIDNGDDMNRPCFSDKSQKPKLEPKDPSRITELQ